jgi:hypothetical protein
MGKEVSETHPVEASVLDMATGNSTDDGAKTENGEVVTKTTTETDDDED